MQVVKFNSGSIILTSASHDVEKDPAIVDHLFAEVFQVFNLFVLTYESWIIDAFGQLSIRILLILSESFIRILSLGINSPNVIGTASFCVEDLKFLHNFC